MRPLRLARAAAAGVAVALLVAGCGGGSATPSASPSSSAAPTSASPSPTGTALTGEAAVIAKTYADFFDPKTTPEQRVALLENGEQFADALRALSQSSLAQAVALKVTGVQLQGADKAAVTFDVLLNGTPTLTNQTGGAVKVDGKWKISASTLCALLTMQGGQVPAPCASASGAATPSAGASG